MVECTNQSCIVLFSHTHAGLNKAMALVRLLQKTDSFSETAYLAKGLETWCHTSQLVVNLAKTKELILSTKQDVNIKPVSFIGQS